MPESILTAAARAYRISIHDRLDEIDAGEWNELAGDNPFLDHAFLTALERQDCLGERFGWLPQHIAARNTCGVLVGGVPLYVKTNSYGEFVFDWDWASAYERSGIAYYPKLVSAIPYTPATGDRLLVHPEADLEAVRRALIDRAVELAKQRGCSGVHWLFTPDADTRPLESQGLMLRLGCQYHWRNRPYHDFEDFLAGFTSRKRKKVHRERRRVAEQSVRLRILHGNEIDERLWETVYRYYIGTFDRKWGIPTLSLGFFKEIGRTLSDRVVLVVAEYRGDPVACALNFKSRDTLYGRLWGCEREFHSLHFETCYYQGIDYCIREGLRRFEPGAQGEYKIGRGFLPARTWSAHWIAHPQFARALEDFCRREQAAMELEYQALMKLSPFREGFDPAL